jgi:hypothetical protein
MNKRNACFAGLAAAVTLLAGCAAQYRNTSSCEDEMRRRLAATTLGELKITHSATTYRGARVVVEGRLEHGMAPAVAASSAQAAQAALETPHASAVQAASAPHASTTAPATAATMVPGMMAVPSAPAAAATDSANGDSKPTTPLAELAEKLGIKKPRVTPAAAECTFNESGLATFRWLAPGTLAKTTPAPDADDE